MEIIKGKGSYEFVMLEEDYEGVITYFKNRTEPTVLQVDFLKCGENTVLQFLNDSEITSIKAVHFINSDKLLKRFEEFTHWTYLTFAYSNSTFDFSELASLEFVGGVWSKRWFGLDKCLKLSSFEVSKYMNDVIDIPNLPNLRSIVLIQPSITTLAGINAAKKLKNLELILAKKLTDISDLKQLTSQITKLVIDGCKNIVSFNIIENLISLEHLEITECKEIETLFFVKGLANLSFLSIYGTKVLDKNFSHVEKNEAITKFCPT